MKMDSIVWRIGRSRQRGDLRIDGRDVGIARLHLADEYLEIPDQLLRLQQNFFLQTGHVLPGRCRGRDAYVTLATVVLTPMSCVSLFLNLNDDVQS